MASFWTVFKFSLFRSRWTVLGWGVPLLLIGLITAPFYDLVAENERELRPIIERLKPFIKSFIGGENTEDLFTRAGYASLNIDDLFTPAGYIALRYFSFIPIFLGIFGAVAGSGMLAADEERGVLDFVLAHPAGRAAVFWGRLAAMGIGLVVIIGLGWFGLWCGVLWADSLNFTPGQIALPFCSVFAVSVLFVTLALALSMMMPSRAAAAVTTGIILLAGFIITSLARGIPGLETLAKFSPLTYFQSNAMQGLHTTPVFGLLAVAAVFSVFAWIGFRNRDIRVVGDGGWKFPFSARR